MMKKQVLSGVLSLVMALTVFCIPVSGFAKDNSGTLKDADYPEMIAGGLTKEEVITMLEVTTVYLGGHKDEKSGKRKLETSCSSFLSEMENFPYNTMIYENVLYPMGVENEGIEKDGKYYNKLPLKDLNKCRAFWNLDPIDKNSEYDSNEIGWIDDKNVYYESWWKHTYTIESMEIMQAKYNDDKIRIYYDISWKNGTIGYGDEDGDKGMYTATLEKNSAGKYALTDIVQGGEPEYDSGFKIGRDNNSFKHTKSSFFKHAQARYVPILNNELYEKLTNGASEGEIAAVQYEMYNLCYDFGGACYGVSSTMAQLYNGLLSATDLSDQEGAKHYYDMGKPKNNEKLRMCIFYYYLSQLLSRSLDSVISAYDPDDNRFKTNADFESTLKTIVEVAKDESKVHMLAIASGETGHQVLITGCKVVPHQYEIKIYDQNYNDQFLKMTVDADYKNFEFGTETGTVNKETCTLLAVIDPSKQITLDGAQESPETDQVPRGEMLRMRVHPTHRLATMRNASGKSFSFENGKISPALHPHDYKHIVRTSDESSDKSLVTEATIDYSEYYDFQTQDNTAMEFGFWDDEGATFVKSTADTARVSMNDGVSFSGSNYSFETTLLTKKKSIDNEPISLRISAEATEDMSINLDDSGGVTLTSKGEISNLEANTMIGVESIKEDVPSTGSHIVIDPSTNACNYGPWENDSSGRTFRTCTSCGKIEYKDEIADDQPILGNDTTFKSKALYVVFIAGIIILLCIAARWIMMRRRQTAKK